MDECEYYNRRSFYQGVFTGAIFLLIQNFKIGDNIPSIEDLNYYTCYSYKKEDLDKTNNDENKSEKYKGISKEDIDREMQLRLEGG